MPWLFPRNGTPENERAERVGADLPLIFSDDLTGACDVGSVCLASGWKVRVEFGAKGWERVETPARDEIVVADLETRQLKPREAGYRAGQACLSFLRRGLRPLMFKMDSTLRGNYIGEARAMQKVLRAPQVWLVPANPGQGRWTVEGRVFVNGITLEKTDYARDPLNPINSARVGGVSAVNLRLDEKSGAGVRSRARALGSVFISADAISGDDLKRIARMIKPRELVFAASPIAGYLTGKKPGKRGEVKLNSRRWLGVIGSLNPQTECQVRAVSGKSGVEVSWIKPGLLFSGGIPPVPSGISTWILALEPVSFRALLKSKSSLSDGKRIAGMLGELASKCRMNFNPAGMILSGGLTAIAACEKMGISGLGLTGMAGPGLVASKAVWSGPLLEIITKPGGFGSDDALLEIVNRIRRA